MLGRCFAGPSRAKDNARAIQGMEGQEEHSWPASAQKDWPQTHSLRCVAEMETKRLESADGLGQSWSVNELKVKGKLTGWGCGGQDGPIKMKTPQLRMICGEALGELRKLASDSVHCVVTSPPYWGLRDYSVEGQLGLEPTLEGYLGRLVEVFQEVRRVLHPSGVCF